MAKKLIIGTNHRDYAEHLSTYIMQNYQGQYSVSVFYDKDEIREYIRGEKCDILLMTRDFYEEEFYLKDVLLPVVLFEGEEERLEDRRLKWYIQKYTRISRLIEYIEEQYEEVERNKPLIYSFYSPSGGVGKTTMAISTAMSYAKAGRKVMYINLEDIDSSKIFFTSAPNLASEVLGELELFINDEAITRSFKEDLKTSIVYLNRDNMYDKPLECRSLGSLIEAIMEKEIVDIVVLDLSMAYNEQNIDFMALSDYIILTNNQEAGSIYKLRQFIQETDFIKLYSEKVRLITNISKASNLKTSIPIIGQVDRVYVSVPMEVCENISNNKLIKLHGLV